MHCFRICVARIYAHDTQKVRKGTKKISYTQKKNKKFHFFTLHLSSFNFFLYLCSRFYGNRHTGYQLEHHPPPLGVYGYRHHRRAAVGVQTCLLVSRGQGHQVCAQFHDGPEDFCRHADRVGHERICRHRHHVRQRSVLLLPGDVVRLHPVLPLFLQLERTDPDRLPHRPHRGLVLYNYGVLRPPHLRQFLRHALSQLARCPAGDHLPDDAHGETKRHQRSGRRITHASKTKSGAHSDA